MADYRTIKQIDADKLDREIFDLCAQLEEFAKKHSQADVDEVARDLFGMRGLVRRHMHKKDQEGTI